MPKLLTPRQVDRALKGLEEWRHEGSFISRTFEFDTFMEGIAFVERVAAVAERQEHHPDIHIRYTTVRLAIQTHSEGGVTSWDIGLARAIQEVAPPRKPEKTRSTPAPAGPLHES
ncbi:MAG: 4a-hydroxytetrahydrobiopterin dehydratase [Nitrososphaerota archaeon]|nr:4a-hydroxytetrahydrobiopterin dehydratase [Nitrososphaerota archaeon]